MRKPSTGEILRGIVATLRGDVLPTITDAGAQRQMRAALFSLDRVRRAWDRWPGYLDADNRDMQDTLARVLEEMTGARAPDERMQALLDRLHATITAGAVQDPHSVTALGDVNDALQALVSETGDLLREIGITESTLAARDLEQLYARMVAREMDAWASQSNDA